MAFDFDAEAAKLPPETKDKAPTTTIDSLTFEAKRSCSTAKERRETLATVVGFDVNHLDNIPELCKLLLDANAASQRAQDEKLKASLRPYREEADALVKQVMNSAHFVFRKDPDAKKQLERIGSIGAMPDRVGDLQRVAAFCEEHPSLLTADERLPRNVVARSRELADLLATVPNTEAAKAALERRNLAYWMLDEAVSEVCAAVRFRFTDDPAFVARVSNCYELPKKKAEPPAPAPATP